MRTFSTLAAVAVALTSASVVSAAVQYTVDDLGGLGGSLGSRGSSVGSSVLVAGTSYLAGNGSLNALTSAVGGGGSVTHVAYPALSGGANSYGMGVGGLNGETLVGYAQVGNRGPYHAISGYNGVTTDLHSTISASAPFTGGTTSRAMAINGSDTVVGQASAGSALQAFSLSGGTATAIPFISGAYANSLAMAVNDGGMVVGFDYTGTWNYTIGNAISGGVTHAGAFSWNGSTLTSLGALGTGLDSLATAVNSAGVIVGQSTLTAADMLDTKGHAFVYSGGTMAGLTELAGTTMSLANDINDSGDIVGTYRTAAFTGHAFIYRNGQMVDLNTLVNGTGWVLIEATSINDDGYITGYGTHNGTPTSFLLAPTAGASVPEPASLGLIGLGAMALVGRRRRA